MAQNQYNRRRNPNSKNPNQLTIILIIAIIIVGIYLFKRCSSVDTSYTEPQDTEYSDFNGNGNGNGNENGNTNEADAEDNNEDISKDSSTASNSPNTFVGNLASTIDITRIPAQKLWYVKMPSSIPSQMLNYTGMTISFNPKLHIPNWVAWELTDKETRGRLDRSDNFMPDPNCRESAQLYDYKRSGYDRGHMCPAADARWDKKFMQEVFYMTNMCPQDHELNTGEWNNLEIKCRDWARIDSAIIIITGPVLTDKLTKTIGSSKVAVPERFFKVILSPFANPPRAIGFVMANRNNPGGMEQNAMSIDEVEEITGYDFFSIIEDKLEDEIESVNDFPTWSKLRKRSKRY